MGKGGARKMTPWLRRLGALPVTHMVSYNCVTSVAGIRCLLSCGHQAHAWHIYIKTSQTCVHRKLKEKEARKPPRKNGSSVSITQAIVDSTQGLVYVLLDSAGPQPASRSERTPAGRWRGGATCRCTLWVV